MASLKRTFLGFLVLIILLFSPFACTADKPDQTTLLLLTYAYLLKSQPTVSCYFTASSGTEYCLQNPASADNLGSTCQFQPLLAHGARTVTNSSSTCQSLGFSTCTILTNTTYETCSR